MSYTARQYADQQRITAIIAKANATRTCLVCFAPQGTWPSGARRMTCGRDACYLRWLAVRPPTKHHSEQEEPHESAVA